MIFDYEVLKFIWWLLIGALLIGFAIADGMDLGVNNLLPFLGKKDEERVQIIASVAPHWDGNQVWLITAGAAIFAAWPIVYAAAFSGLYMALLLVLFALFFRPVGFEYRAKADDPRWRAAWDWAIFASGFVPSLVFGVAFGNLLQGLPFHLDELMRSHYEGSLLTAFLPLLNPFALLCGVISVSMLTMHGALWLQLRTDGPVQQRARKTVSLLAPLTVIGFAVAGIWVAYGIDGFRIVSQAAPDSFSAPLAKVVERAPGAWLDIYQTYPVAMLAPVLGFAGALIALLLSVWNRPGFGFLANGVSVAGIIGTAGLSLFPFIFPSKTSLNSSLTVWDSTSSHLTLTIMFWVVALMMPLVLAYTAWCYKRMWGKVSVQTPSGY